MPHTKYNYIMFQKFFFNNTCSYIYPPGEASFYPPGPDWQDFMRGLLDIATNQIHKLWTLWFQKKNQSFSQVICLYVSFMFPPL